MDPGALLPLLVATLLGAFVQAVTGFGFALLAAPTFLIVIGSVDAIGVLVGVQFLQSTLVVPKIWRTAPRSLLSLLIAGSLIGMPLGLFFLAHLDLPTLKLSVGIAMIAFVSLLVVQEVGGLAASTLRAYSAFTGHPLVVGLIGLVSGFMGAALVMPGPPVILLIASLALAKLESRSLALTFFGFCFAATLVLHAASGGMTVQAWSWIAVLLPAILVGTYLGNRAVLHLTERWFRVVVLAIASVSGLYAIASSF